MGDYVLVQSKCRKFEVSFSFLLLDQRGKSHDNKIFLSIRFFNDPNIMKINVFFKS